MWDDSSFDRRTMLLGLTAAGLLPGCASRLGPAGQGEASLLHRDDFRAGLDQWRIEAEQGGRFSAQYGVLDIDSPAGVTLWFRPALAGPVAIEYEVTAVAEGGPNDAVSDINC